MGDFDSLFVAASAAEDREQRQRQRERANAAPNAHHQHRRPTTAPLIRLREVRGNHTAGCRRQGGDHRRLRDDQDLVSARRCAVSEQAEPRSTGRGGSVQHELAQGRVLLQRQGRARAHASGGDMPGTARFWRVHSAEEREGAGLTWTPGMSDRARTSSMLPALPSSCAQQARAESEAHTSRCSSTVRAAIEEMLPRRR